MEAGMSERFHLHAYVCSGVCVHRMSTDDSHPTRNFTQVFVKRPNKCRYAVVGQWTSQQRQVFLVFDLFKVDKVPKLGGDELITPEPVLTHDDLDAAIMGTVLLYEEGR